MLHALLILSLFPSPTGQELPAYFIKLIQERTLFAADEHAMLTIRLGNQVEGALKPRRFPDLIESIHVYQGDTEIERDPKYDTTKLKLAPIGYGAHHDFRIDLGRYFPAVSKGGIFRIRYKDKHFDIAGRNVSVLTIPMPDLTKNYQMKTSLGEVTLQVDATQTPAHAKNFALLVATQFYRDMIFHRVEPGVVIQTGDPQGNGTGGSGFSLALEKSPFMRHKKYALGMARQQDPDSADSQFYICLEETKAFDDKYTVFGRVVAGFDVIDAIGKVPTTGPSGEPPSRPLTDVNLISILPIDALPE